MSRTLHVNTDPAAVAAWCRSHVSPGSVYVASSAASRRLLLRELTSGGAVAIGLAVTSQRRLVTLLESRAGLPPLRMVPATLSRLLLHEAARAAGVALFQGGATPRGARQVVSGAIREMRMNRVSPDDFLAAGGDTRIGETYRRYERRRTDLGFHDEADRVERLLGAALPAVPLVFEDPSIDDALGAALFARLVGRAPSVHAGIAHLRESPDATGALEATLRALGFEVHSDRATPARPAAMRVIGGVGAADEVELVAREILAMIRAGTRAADITVVAPASRYRDAMHVALARIGIPVASPRRMSVLDVPVVRALRTAFTLLVDGESDTAGAGLSLLTSPYLGLSLSRQDRLGRELVKRSAGSLRSWASFRVKENPRGFNELAAALPTLEAALAGDRAPRELATVVTRLALDFRFLSSGRRAYLAADQDDAVRLDQQGWNALVGAMEELASCLSDAGITRLSASRWLGELVEILSDSAVRVDARGLDGVHITMAGTGIASSPHVFALGWREGLVPRRVREDPVLPDDVRARLNARGARFQLAQERPASEFERRERIVRSARESLTISWPATNEDGDAQIASWYIEDLGLRAVASRKVGDPTWPMSIAASRGERLARATLAARHHPAARLNGEGALVDEALARLTASEANAWRGDRHAPQVIPLSIAAVEMLAPLAAEMSASQARTATRCTYAHFGDKRLRLQPLESPALDVAALGTIAHDVLATLGREGLRAERVGPVLESMWAQQGAAVIRNAAAALELEVLSTQLAALLEQEGPHFAQSAAVPMHFELAFGLSGDDGKVRDPHSRPDGVRLALEDALPIASTMLRGSIDRVDIVERDGVRYGVAIDYKSGKGNRYGKALEEMLDFQLPIYCEAMRAFGIEPVGAFFLGIGSAQRFGFVRADFADAFIPAQDDRKGIRQLDEPAFSAYVGERLDALRTQVARLVRGELAVRPREDDCGHCRLRPVCRVGTFAVGGKHNDG